MQQDRIHEFICHNLNTILKEPRGFIHYPFTDPGSVYDGNVWDWDTYWTVYGLLPLLDELKDADLTERVLQHAKGNVLNFLDWQLPDGYIPMMIEIGKWPEPYLNIQHKQGHKMNMHKPFLCQQIALISEYAKDWSWILDAAPQIDRYLNRYHQDYFNENCRLYVWQDDIMIGMDNDPASFGRPPASTANIFLNSFMVMELEAAEKFYERVQEAALHPEQKRHWEERAARVHADREDLIRSIHEQMFDERDGFFYSQDVDIHTRKYDWFHQGLGVFWKTLPIRIAVWSGFLPMLAGFATKKEAQCLRNWYHKDEAFGSAYGITTLDRREKMFCIQATNNPSDWLGPIWIVASYCVFRGFLQYHMFPEAEELCQKTTELLSRDLKETGCLHEYYDPDTGKPVMNGGFINWNILALNMQRELRVAKEGRR